VPITQWPSLSISHKNPSVAPREVQRLNGQGLGDAQGTETAHHDGFVEFPGTHGSNAMDGSR
jgi:hypothetical protein